MQRRRTRERRLGAWLLVTTCGSGSWAAPADAQDVSRYDVTWTAPSADAGGSMPLGNGDISLNAWVEPSGDLRFYIGKTDSWGAHGRLLKVGRLRVSLDPPLALPLEAFDQRLNLRDGVMEVRCGGGDDAVDFRLWVDAHDPVVRIEIESTAVRAATVVIERWRTARVAIPAADVSDTFEDRSRPHNLRRAVFVGADELIADRDDRIGWYHHARERSDAAELIRIQGLADAYAGKPDPLLNRVFGAIVTAPGGERLDAERLQSPAGRSHRFDVHVHAAHPSSPAAWREAVDAQIAAMQGDSAGENRAAHRRWWNEFWQRSWIDVAASGTPETADEAFVVSRAYALQRYVEACAGRGRYPIKFNGSTLTVPHEGRWGDADYRRWGPGYWWQNTRLPYLSMCASGDFEMFEPLFRMYVDEHSPINLHRTRRYTGHGGLFIPECVYFWGGTFAATYGWTPFEERGEDKLQESPWHKWEWVSGLELAWMMLDYYDHTQDAGFLRERLLPFATEVLRFYDEQFEVDDAGRLRMEPMQALETWWDTTNPTPDVAGLRAVTTRLLALPADVVATAPREYWARIAARVPELPVREIDGVRMLAPAARFDLKRNVENPELYAVFPFRLVSFEKPDASLGVAALAHRADRGASGWRQDDLFMTHLGLGPEARENLVARRNRHAGSRFPAFWGPNYDWIPDQTHGGVLMRTVQTMLMQTEGRAIYLLPAWPEDWSATFRLHAPYRTVVSGRVEAGVLVDFTVEPPERRTDVIVCDR